MMTRTRFIKEASSLIQTVLKLNRVAIRGGIQALECEVEDLDDEDLKQGLRLLIDGARQSIIDEILSNKIMFERNKYAKRYKTILKRAILAIREREKTYSLVKILISYVGLTHSEEQKLEESLHGTFVNFPLEEDDGGNQLIISDGDKNPSLIEERKKRLFAFDELTRLDDRAIQKLFRELDSIDLIKAMKGAGKHARDRIFSNLGKRAAAELSEEMDYMEPISLDEAEKAQRKTGDIIKRLEQ